MSATSSQVGTTAEGTRTFGHFLRNRARAAGTLVGCRATSTSAASGCRSSRRSTPRAPSMSAAIERLCNEYLAAGVNGIVALGTTGESSALDAAEQQLVIDTCTRVCGAAGQRRHRRHRHQQHAHHDRGVRSACRACPPSSPRSSSCRITCGRPRPRSSSTSGPLRPRARCRSSSTTSRRARAAASGAASLLELAQRSEHRGREASGRDARRRHARRCSPTRPTDSRCSAARTRCCSRSCAWARRGTISAAAHLCTERFVAMIECGLAGKIDDGRAHAEALLPVVRSAYVEPESRDLQGRAARAGPHRDARRAPAARRTRRPRSIARVPRCRRGAPLRSRKLSSHVADVSPGS